MNMCRKICVAVALVFLPAVWAGAQRDLTGLSLEELLNVEVVSVTRKAESLEAVASAITVISKEDIRRSAANDIVDLLRTVPGVNVARLDAHETSVTIRGFSGVFANRLLVLVDGRSVYTPLFGGVYWEYQDIPLNEIERIEVIRGPGASVWGANAVNGVINIITKSAFDTEGGLVQGIVGTPLRASTYLRYGMPAGEHGALRLYGMYRDHDGFDFSDRRNSDRWSSGRIGMRFDWDDQAANAVTVTAHFLDHGQRNNYVFSDPYFPYARVVRGREVTNTGHASLSYTRRFSEGNELTMRGSFARFVNHDALLDDRNNTIEWDLHHRIDIGERHTFQYGLAYRFHDSKLQNVPQIAVNPSQQRDQHLSAFLQDTMQFRDGRLRLTLGAKIEWNEYTGLEIQPSARLAYDLSDTRMFWVAASRAVRTPTRVERDIVLRAFGFPNALARLEGNRDFKSENVIALEAGYRHQHRNERVAFDVAAFYFFYDDMRTIELGRPRFQLYPPLLILPFEGRNNAKAQSFGFEVATDWQARENWLLRASYSYLNINLQMRNRGLDIVTPPIASDTPRHQATLSSLVQLTETLDMTATVRHVGTLRGPGVPSYTELDLRLGWSPRENLDLELFGRDLIRRRHTELAPALVNSVGSEIPRGVYGRVTWRF